MKKKIILLPLVLLALAACDGAQNPTSSSAPSSNASEQPSENVSSNPNSEVNSESENESSNSESVSDSENSENNENSENSETSENSENSENQDSSTDDDTNLSSIEEVLDAGIALGSGDGKTSSAEQYTFEGTITSFVGNSYYVQDQDGYAIYVYYNSKFSGVEVKVGDVVKVTSKITNYYGLVETFGTDTTATLEKVSEGTPIVPTEIEHVSELNQKSQSKLVTIKGLTYVSGSVDVNNASNLTFTFDGQSVTLRVDKYCNIKDELKTKLDLDNVASGDTFDFIGINIGWFNGLQFSLGESTDVEIHKAPHQAVTGVTAKDSVEVEVGKSVDLEAKVLPENATDKELIYEVADPQYAEVVEGRVKGLEAGQTTITVKSHEDETKSCVVNVTVIPATSDVKTANYGFVASSPDDTKYDTAYTDATAGDLFEKFNKVDGDIEPTSVSNVSFVYPGAYKGNKSDTTNYFSYENCIKIGKSNTAGTLNINFDDNVKISKVVVKLVVWKSGTKLTINNVEKTPTTLFAKDCTPEELTFEFDETSTLEISTTERVIVWEFAITYTSVEA